MSGEVFTVLLVEDNPRDARLLEEAVKDSGSSLRLDWVETLGAAVERLRDRTFDAVLLDLSLPDAHGLETLARIRLEAPSIAIVVLTGFDDAATAATALREGAQDYLVKGKVDGELLIRAIRYSTERKRATDAVRRREEHFRSLIENALDIIAVVDEAGTIRYASPSLERVTGSRSEELIGSSAFRLIHPDDVAAVERALAGCVGFPGMQSVEFRVRHRTNGRWRVLEAICRSLLNDPAVAGIVVNCRDITDRREAEEQLRKLHETLRAVIETSPLAILSLDLDGHVQSWNRAAERIFGWRVDEVIRRPLPVFLEMDREGLRDHPDSVRRDDVPVGRASRLRRKNGSLLDVHLWTGLLRDGGGAVSGVVALIADVTESKRLEEQLRQAQKMDAVGRLAGGVAHDFNNLLTVITGSSQLISRRLEPEDPIRGELDQVLRAADRAANLTRQLLMFSRRQLVEPRTLDLNALVSDTYRMLQRIIGEDIELVLKLGFELPTIRADASQIETVILNLAVNARDAMPDGGRLTIATDIAELGNGSVNGPAGLSPGSYVTVAVSDTGSGMSAAATDHLFEPFFTTKAPGRGTGLGLSTSYGIVRQHGGDFQVCSEIGKGSTFRVFLPAAAAVSPQPVRVVPKSAGIAHTETILLVEDEDGVRHVISEMLSGEGYRVLAAGGPEEGIRLCRDHPGTIHLLVSDVIMPHMNGVDLAVRLRAIRPQIKVLYVSGYAEGALTEGDLSDRGTAFLQKPFSPDLLALKIREVLES
jgi:PAS domain S-box-containing protein